MNEKNDAPIGFLMALSQDERAMTRYSRLSKQQRQQILEKARQAQSSQQMHKLISQIGNSSGPISQQSALD